MLQPFALPLLVYCLAFATAGAAKAACIDLKETNTFSFQGTLSYHIFAGPPNYEDVRKGDAPEATYILKLDEPICATGDDFLNPSERIDKVQVYPADAGARDNDHELDMKLREPDEMRHSCP